MNKALLVGGIAIVLLLIAFGGFGIMKVLDPDTPEEEFLQRQVEDLKEQIAKLESKNQRDTIRIRDLYAQVEKLAAAQPGRLATEEERKALAVREADLDRREKQLVQSHEQLRLARRSLDDERQKFYNERGLKVEEIGQAKEIKENQERMIDRLTQAEERANNWLKAIYAISILFLVGIISFVAFLMHMAAKNRRIDAAMRTVESVGLSTPDRNLLIASLGGRIIEHPSDNDSDH